MSGHTPGPWFVADWDNDFGDNMLVVEVRQNTGSGIWPDGIEKRQVSDLRESSFDQVTALANARLIAAAPDLLEAAEDALRVIEQTDEMLHRHGMMEGVSNPVIATLRAAIARATSPESPARGAA